MGQEQRQPTAALRDLLTDLFGPGELRRWMYGNFPRELIHELPGEAVSCAEMSHVAVGLLERYALIDEALFDRLVEARKRRSAEIDEVRALYSQGVASRRLDAQRSDPKRTWERPYRIAVRSTLLLSAIWILTRGYPGLDASQALKASSDGIFSFLPTFHRRWALPALTGTAALFTALFWLLALRQRR